MGTKLRTELSKKNPYWIPKERRLELVHFCRQYPDWRDESRYICESVPGYGWKERVQHAFSNPTELHATRIIELGWKMDMVERSAGSVVDILGCRLTYGQRTILKVSLIHHVTDGGSYETIGVDDILSKYEYMRCYHAFFWVLDKLRERSAYDNNRYDFDWPSHEGTDEK